MPQTYADLDEKLKVLGYLRLKQSDAACKAMLAALTGGHDLIVPTPKPRWRDFSVANPQTVGWSGEAYSNLAPEWREKVVVDLVKKDDVIRDVHQACS